MSGLNLGDVVVLKSGGPKLTIETVVGLRANCQWFDGKDLKGGSIPLASLEVFVQPAPISLRGD